MKKTLENLWNDYLMDECSTINTDEEREHTKDAAMLHEKLNDLLNEEQKEAVEKYVESLYEIQAFFLRKAFYKGCEFSVSFLIEAGNFGK